MYFNVFTESYMYMDQNYETLRTTSVILAVVMFVTGILIALSKSINHRHFSVKSSNARNPSKSFSHKCAALTVHVD
uniref:FXYD domain-containing ion transport regulator n=1 Tax=Sinocyclocheilus rhinocerous TaxID=307959 RepID=A0A673JCZ6_9TELE